MLKMAELEALQQGQCPDCKETDIRPGPRGGVSQNVACGACGNEFNVARHSGRIVLGHRTSVPGHPNVQRLRQVYDVELPDGELRKPEPPNQPMVTGIVVKGPFSAQDLRDLMQTLRLIDQRNPLGTYTLEALAPDGTIEQGKQLMQHCMPEMIGRSPVERSTMEKLTDEERQLLIVLVTQAHVNIRDNPDMTHANDELNHILSMLTGTDTVIWAERAYPSRRRG